MAEPGPARATEGDAHADGPPAYPGMPRWVKVFGIVVIVLAPLIAILVFTGVGGQHGPGRHGGGGDIPTSAVAGHGIGGGAGGRTPPDERWTAGREVRQP